MCGIAGILDFTHALSPSDLGLLDLSRVRTRWQEHLAGKRDAYDELWTVISLQAWLVDARA